MLTIDLPIDSLLIWILVGLVAGFLASHVILGHGLGVFTDAIVGVLGAIVGGWLASYFQFRVAVAGHPLISEMIVAFFGAMIVLLVLRLLSMGARRGRAF
jgi:uncharacterized membrane protein YeaQ/YmgE (transglycosylase-associated protein family)